MDGVRAARAGDGRWRIVLASGAVIPSVGADWVEFTMPESECESDFAEWRRP